MRVNRTLSGADSAGAVGEVPSGQSTEPIAVPTTAAPAVAPQTPAPPAASTPAADTVINGEVTEETLRLRETVNAREAEIEQLKRDLKNREVTVCEYQDKLHALTQPTPIPVTKSSGTRKFGFMRRNG